MRRQRLLTLIALLTVGTVGGVFLAKTGQPTRKSRAWTFVSDARCLGGCTDSALLRILPTVPQSAIAAGTLQGTKGQTVTVTRASNKTCDRGSVYLDPTQSILNGDNFSVNWGGGSNAAAADPFGGTSATLFTEDTSSGLHGAQSIPIAPGNTNTASAYTETAYLKAGTSSCAGVTSGNTLGGCQWDLSAGSVLKTTGTVTCSISAVSGYPGWYRGVAFFSAGTGAADNTYLLNNSACALSGVPNYTGTSKSFYAFGLKVKQGADDGLYIPGNNQRLVYLSSNKPCVEPNGLLIEAASTNLMKQSAALDNVGAWTATGATVTADQGIAPDGTLTADRVVFGSGTGQLNHQIGQSSTGTFSATTNTCSFWVRSIVGTATVAAHIAYVAVADYFSSDFTATTTWQKLSFTQTFPANASTSASCGPTIGSALAAADVLITDIQFEQQPFSTSYIPTVAATATRSADTLGYGTVGSGALVGMNKTTGCAGACVTPAGWSTSSPLGGALFQDTTTSILYANGGDPNLYSFNGTTAAAVSAGALNGVKKCYRIDWVAGSRTIYNLTDGVSGSDPNGFVNTLSGSLSASGLPAWLQNMSVGAVAGACN